MTRSIVLHAVTCTLAGLGLAGCNPLYLAQAAGGQARLLADSRPVPQVLADSRTGPELRQRLDAASSALQFAHAVLGLPDNGSYRSYVELDRPFAVWNVFAAPEFSLALETWCFPVAGCVAYRGYFEQPRARKFADGLAAQGKDILVAGAAAYSTLGYFRDPLLSSVLRLPEQRVAGLIFHELAHQQLYVAGDTIFNESFATLVEQEGLVRWLEARGDRAGVCRFLEGLQREQQVRLLIAQTRKHLEVLYAGNMPDAALRAAKAGEFASLRGRYRELRARWSGPPYFDGWFDAEINNASLGALAAYDQLVGTLRVILDSEGGQLPVFYRRAARLGRLGKAERAEVLSQIRPINGPAAADRDCRAG